MLLLILYVLLAVGFSFLCSIAEAVLLSVTTSYVRSLQQDGRKAGPVLKQLKDDINSPLAVILTLNTIAHTMGAAGAGAQATKVFGSAYLGIFSAFLTLAVLLFSEIIPKALGATFWRQLAPTVGYSLTFLIKALKPFVWASNMVTSRFSHHGGVVGFTRKEFAAMADLGEEEGQLDPHESRVLKNLFQLRNLTVRQIMTPKPVVFAVAENLTVNEFFDQYLNKEFSRIPITRSEDDVTGFVLRADLLLAHAQGEGASPLARYKRELPAMLDVFSVLNAFNDFVERDLHIMLVVNEYGETQGLVTLEDVLETLLGLEIVDERDRFSDMQEVAKRLASLRQLKRDETNH